MEEIIFEIIANGGNAKALAYEAIREAAQGKFNQAHELLKEADESLKIAHNTQTKIISEEANGHHIQVSVLFVHAQDHLMTAIEVRDLANIIIDQYQRIYRLENN